MPGGAVPSEPAWGTPEKCPPRRLFFLQDGRVPARHGGRATTPHKTFQPTAGSAVGYPIRSGSMSTATISRAGSSPPRLPERPSRPPVETAWLRTGAFILMHVARLAVFLTG